MVAGVVLDTLVRIVLIKTLFVFMNTTFFLCTCVYVYVYVYVYVCTVTVY
jgi:hypothetical protein